MSVPPAVLFGLALVLPVGLFGLRQALARFGTPDEGDLLSAVLSPANAAAASGIAIGLAATPPSAQLIGEFASMSTLFISAWCGFAIGCGIDLRLLRKTSSVLLASQLGQCIVAMLVIPILAYGLARAGVMQSALLSPAALLIAAGMCLSGGASSDPAGADRGHRSGAANRGGPKPSIAALVAILLVTIGGGLDPVVGTFAVTLPFVILPEVSLSISGGADRVLAGLCMGCIAGLLGDLTAKGHSSAGLTFCILAGVLLVVGGLAAQLGLQPLLVGLTAGAWVMNATLRRLDIRHVIERSRTLSAIGVPLLVGLALGHGIAAYGIDGESIIVGVALLMLIRPLVRIAGWRLGEHLIKAKNPQPVSRDGESLPLDNTGFVIALVLVWVVPGSAATGFLAAALFAQIAFGAAERVLGRVAEGDVGVA